MLALTWLVTSVVAQPLAPSCYQPDRIDAWSGPSIAIGCLACCGCRDTTLSTQWQFRRADAGWTGLEPTFDAGGRFVAIQTQPAHLESVCMRVRFSDGIGPGDWGPSTGACGVAAADHCFTWDNVDPTIPVLLDAGVNAGDNQLIAIFAPSTDDGGGVSHYTLHYVEGISQYGFGRAPSSPVTDVLGAGTWRVSVYATDRAGNPSTRSNTLTVAFGFDAAVAIPPSPGWPSAVGTSQFVTATWPDDGGAESWVTTIRGSDGGWRIGTRPHVNVPSALIDVSGTCRRSALRIATVIGTQVSDWSAPSPDYLTDTLAPNAATPSVAVDGGVAFLDWAAATDLCPSGLNYRLERSLNSGAFVSRGALTPGLTAMDVLDVEGSLQWRVLAIDGAGNQGRSTPSATVIVTFDAGAVVLDAGSEADAGTEQDGGIIEVDRRELAVGCSCSSAPGALLLLALLRRKRACQRCCGRSLGCPSPSSSGSGGVGTYVSSSTPPNELPLPGLGSWPPSDT